MSRTFLAVLQFDGRGFIGWQRQATGRTVQGEIERVLQQLAGRAVTAHAAGRTDAGVHAEGLGVSFAMPSRWDAEELRRALNALLPADCWTVSVAEMQSGFHARKHAQSRRYRYVIGTDAASASPFRRPFEWALGRPLARELLDQAAAALPGEHQFEAFSVRGQPHPHHRCIIAQSTWRDRTDDMGVEFHVEADRFLHHMVRMLVGTMVDIGLERRPLADMRRLLDSTDNQDTSPPAPAEGLYFVEASYPADAYLASQAAPAGEAVHA